MAVKIKSVEYAVFDNDALMELFVPIKWGYMDRNTAYAAWNINHDLRPDDSLLRSTIDRDFLEALIKAYY